MGPTYIHMEYLHVPHLGHNDQVLQGPTLEIH
jgi:hypothetical protein